MVDEAHGVDVATGQEIIEGARRVNDGELERARQVQITELSTSLLRKFNRGLDATTISDYFLSRENLFSTTPLDALRKEERPEREYLKGYDDALAIARYYWENRDVDVPQRLSYCTTGRDLEDEIKPGEKVLFFLDEEPEYGRKESTENEVIEFTGKSKKRWRKPIEELEKPDVFLKKIDTYAWDSTFKYSTKKSSVRLKGIDNLMIGGDIELKPHEITGGGIQIDLSAEGRIAILPGARLIAGSIAQGINGAKEHSSGASSIINLSIASGDVVQYPDSEVAVDSVRCENYIQEGGEIKTPGSRKIVIECTGSFVPKGGTRPEEPFLEIKDSDYLERIQLSSVREQIMGHQLGIGGESDKDKKDESGAESEPDPEIEFAAKYPPTVEIHGKDGIVTRGYNLGADPSVVAEFNARAIALGWEIANETQVGTIMTVTLKRASKE